MERQRFGSGIYRFNNGSWILQNPTINDVFVVAEESMYAVGDYGTIKRFKDDKWQRMQTGTTKSINGIWASADDNVFAVGDNRIVLHFDGTSWAAMDSGAASYSENLNAIWGSSAENIYAVGNKGLMLHYDGKAWKEVSYAQLKTSNNLYSIYGTSADNIYAAGVDVVHYDGKAWFFFEIPNQDTAITSIFISDDNSIYFSAFGNLIYYFDGKSKWNEIHYPVEDHSLHPVLGSVYGQSSDDIYIVGTIINNNEGPSEGFVAKYDGKNWDRIDILQGAYVTSITGVEGVPRTLYGINGLLLNYNLSKQKTSEGSDDVNEQIVKLVNEKRYSEAVKLLEKLQQQSPDPKREDLINRIQQYIKLSVE